MTPWPPFEPYVCRTLRLRGLFYAFRGILLGAVAFVSSSCRPHTYNSTTTYFPAGTTHGSAQYALVVEADGQRGKAYLDFGQKRVFVIVLQNKSTLIRKEYTIEAGDLFWRVRWDEATSPEVDFFERGNASNIIKKVTLKINP
jgi:hypothetical protein